MAFKIETVQQNQIETLLIFIKKLAQYEKMEDVVTTTVEDLEDAIFVKKIAHARLLYEANQVIGFLLFFYKYSTFTGKTGIYLEDIFIDEAYRGKGYGKKVFEYLALYALENKCARFEWTCLKWNKPSLDFYQSLGAQTMDEWMVHRLDKVQLEVVSKKGSTK